MEEVTDYSNLPNYVPEVNKIILAEARDALSQKDINDLVSAKHKLQFIIFGSLKFFIGSIVKKIQAIADSIIAVDKEIEEDITKKAKLRNELLEISIQALEGKLEHEAQRYEKEPKIIEKDHLKKQFDSEIQNVMAIADGSTVLREKIDEITRKSQPQIKSSTTDKREPNEPKDNKLVAIHDKPPKAAESFARLEEKIQLELGKVQAIASTLMALEVDQQGTDSLNSPQEGNILKISDLLVTSQYNFFSNLSCTEKTVEEIADTLTFLKKEFEKSIGHRAFGFKINLHNIILRILNAFHNEINITYSAFETLISMSRDQPVILNDDGISIAKFYLDCSPVSATRQQIMRWFQTCMMNCEENRKKLHNADIMSLIDVLIQDDTTISPVINDVCQTIRALVEHENCQSSENSAEVFSRIDEIANTLLERLIYFLRKFLDNKLILMNVIITIRKLLVKNYLIEYLIRVQNGKALLYLQDIFIYHREEQDLIWEMLCLFDVMVHNDIAKSTMMEAGIAYIIKHAMDTHQNSEKIIEITFHCLANISLRCPFNTALFIDFGFAARIVREMDRHSSNFPIQKIGNWLIRLFITYRNELVPYLINLGAPKVLYNTLNIHKFKCEFDAKAALRDLKEEIELFEPISKPDTQIKFPLLKY